MLKRLPALATRFSKRKKTRARKALNNRTRLAAGRAWSPRAKRTVTREVFITEIHHSFLFEGFDAQLHPGVQKGRIAGARAIPSVAGPIGTCQKCHVADRFGSSPESPINRMAEGLPEEREKI